MLRMPLRGEDVKKAEGARGLVKNTPTNTNRCNPTDRLAPQTPECGWHSVSIFPVSVFFPITNLVFF